MCINFVKIPLDVLDNLEEFQGHYIVMDNAPIHTSKDIKRHITSRGVVAMVVYIFLHTLLNSTRSSNFDLLLKVTN